MANKIVSVTQSKFECACEHVLQMFEWMDQGVMGVRSGQTDPSYWVERPDGRRLVLTRSDQGNGFLYTAKLVTFDKMTEVDVEGAFVENTDLSAFRRQVTKLCTTPVKKVEETTAN